MCFPIVEIGRFELPYRVSISLKLILHVYRFQFGGYVRDIFYVVLMVLPINKVIML